MQTTQLPQRTQRRTSSIWSSTLTPSGTGSKVTRGTQGGCPERAAVIARPQKGEKEKEGVVVYGLRQWQYYVVSHHVRNDVPSISVSSMPCSYHYSASYVGRLNL